MTMDEEELLEETTRERGSRCREEVTALLMDRPMSKQEIMQKVPVPSSIKKSKFFENLLYKMMQEGEILRTIKGLHYVLENPPPEYAPPTPCRSKAMAPEDMDIPKFGEVMRTGMNGDDLPEPDLDATAFEDADVAAKVKELMDVAAVEAWAHDPEGRPNRAVITIDISLELTDQHLLHLDQGNIKEILKAAGVLSSWAAFLNG